MHPRRSCHVLCLGLALSLAAPAFANDAEIDRALARRSSGDFAGAQRALKPLADAGNARAIYELALMHYYGTGTPRDAARARALLLPIQAQHAAADVLLAELLMRGEGGPADAAAAGRLLAARADSSPYGAVAQAQWLAYFQPGGVTAASIAAGLAVARTAAPGFAAASELAGDLASHPLYRASLSYRDERGARAEALAHYRVAAEAGSRRARTRYADLSPVDHSVEGSATLQRYAEQGDAASAAQLGWRHTRGHAERQNLPLGVQWSERAAQQGHPVGLRVAGLAYLYGKGVAPDVPKATRYLLAAAEKRDGQAAAAISDLFRAGDPPFNRDLVKAREWINAAITMAADAPERSKFEAAARTIDTIAAQQARREQEQARADAGLQALAATVLGAIAVARAISDATGNMPTSVGSPGSSVGDSMNEASRRAACRSAAGGTGALSDTARTLYSCY